MKMYCADAQCQGEWNEQNPTCLTYGEPNYAKCKSYIEANKVLREETENVMPENEKAEQITWNGEGMGLADTALISQQRLPFVVGVVGEANAGKTTLLAMLYMLLRQGKSIGKFSFAGSYTLLGWEKIAEGFRFKTYKRFSFPPHTTSNDSLRIPSLLHFLLKNTEKERYQNVLFTDASGEWFSKWAVSAETPEAKGARWVDENADTFILVADSEAFAKNVGKARKSLLEIAERMRNSVGMRPVALVWAKSDVEVSSEVKAKIFEKVQANLPQAKPFEVAIGHYPENSPLLENILSIVDYLLTENTQKRNTLPAIEVKNKDDFFFAIREYGK